MKKRVLVPLADGFEEIEAITVIDILRRAGAEVMVAALQGEIVKGSHGIAVIADAVLELVKSDEFDLVVLPGGLPGSTNLKKDKRIIELIQRHNQNGKLISAICAAPTVLAEYGLLNDKRFTLHPSQISNVSLSATNSQVECDGQLITGQAAGAAMKFAFALVEKLFGPVKVAEVNRSVLSAEL